MITHRNMDRHMCVYTYVLICMCIFFAQSAERAQRNNTPVAMSISSAQILVSNAIIQLKEIGLLGEMADSKIGAGNILDDPGAFYSTRM